MLKNFLKLTARTHRWLKDNPASFWEFAYFQGLLLLVSGRITFGLVWSGKMWHLKGAPPKWQGMGPHTSQCRPKNSGCAIWRGGVAHQTKGKGRKIQVMDLVVSENSGTPQLFHFNRFFSLFTPSILGVFHLFLETPIYNRLPRFLWFYQRFVLLEGF